MSAEGAVGLGIKSGLLGGLFVAVVSTIAVVLGFTVVPLTPGKEHLDVMRRLAAGLICSFTLGPLLAFKAIDMFPWLMTPWNSILAGQPVLWVYLAAAAPFIAVTAVCGFWIVGATMRWFQKREGKDLVEMIQDARDDAKKVLP